MCPSVIMTEHEFIRTTSTLRLVTPEILSVNNLLDIPDADLPDSRYLTWDSSVKIDKQWQRSPLLQKTSLGENDGNWSSVNWSTGQLQSIDRMYTWELMTKASIHNLIIQLHISCFWWHSSEFPSSHSPDLTNCPWSGQNISDKKEQGIFSWHGKLSWNHAENWKI